MKQSVIHVWDVHEIVLYAKKEYDNPYTEVIVWADLKGPSFEKRVYGFWDGENIFRIRVTATVPGTWIYTTGSSTSDEGLNGISGSYEAIAWSEEEKQENPCRRGIIRASENRHALEYADGTPYYMVGDTWWGLASYRYPWVDDEAERPIGPDMSVKDMARQRRSQGYNTVGTIVAFPTWADDGRPGTIMIDDGHETFVRGAWGKCSVMDWLTNSLTGSYPARDMHNEGGRPFFFPGKIKGYEDLVPDYDRINPAYFQSFDRKVNWLNQNGFTVFMEALRRDSSRTWKYYYDWPMVYTRYIQYLFARYQANNILFSPIHYDGKIQAIDSREFNEPIDLMIDLYGKPPFGTLFGTNAPGSTKTAFGGPDEQHWKTFEQTGNWRDHQYHWLLKDIFEDENHLPAVNGEPYYSGHISFIRSDNGEMTLLIGNVESVEDQLNCRSSYWGSTLSGAYGGILAGFEAGWSGNVEPEETPWKIWDTMTFPASYMLYPVKEFLFSEGKRYQDLIPNSDLAVVNYKGETSGWRGWITVAATKKRDLIMGYSEKDAPIVRIRGLHPYDLYDAFWFNPRTSEWTKINELEVDFNGEVSLGDYPDRFDWAFKLLKTNKEYRLDPGSSQFPSFESKEETDSAKKSYGISMRFIDKDSLE